MQRLSLSRRALSEGVGSALLLATVVGSGIMAERLSGGNGVLALLANSIATGAGLVALIAAFGPLSGAHLNPVVTLAQAARGKLSWRDVPRYVFAQISGSCVGVVLAHLMFEVPPISFSEHARAGPGVWLAEILATFGLLVVILGCEERRTALVPLAVGAYITAAYWFTSSTSFANPAVAMARSLTNTFSGIRPTDVPAFIGAELVGAIAALALWSWLRQHDPETTPSSGGNVAPARSR
jgi:glycerol uptake facilitator-like aquaporin